MTPDNPPRRWPIALLLALLALAVPFSLAHSSSEEIVVRVESRDLSTHTYTFSCDIPADAVYPRTFSVRTTKSVNTVAEVQPGETFTYSFDNDLPAGENPSDVFHVACQTGIPEDGTVRIARGDFHLDLRPDEERRSAYPDRTNLFIESAADLSVNATCIPASTSASTTADWKFLYAHGEGLITYSGPLSVSQNLSKPGLWDVECGVDGTWWPIPIEFLEDGHAYVPSETGCIYEGCAETSPYYDIEAPAPSVSVNVSVVDSSVLLDIAVADFTLVPASDGTNHVAREGHLHWYVDGVKQGRIYSEGVFDAGAWPAGEHTLRLTLSAKDHREVRYDGMLVEESVPFTIESAVNDTNQTACYASVRDVPISCSGGTIQEDTWNGCRSVLCSDGSESIQALACDKQESFEAYRQFSSGALEICFGDVCVGEWGYRSGDLPYCVDDEPSVPVCGNAVVEQGETCDDGNTLSGDGCSSTCQTETAEPVCYDTIQDLPATCDGGTITSDSYNGCRTVVCSTDSDSMQVLVCPKDGGAYEAYRQSEAPVTVCVGEACISGNGFDRQTLPYCPAGTGTNQTAVPVPVWLEPSAGRTDVNPFDLHMHVFDMNGTGWLSTDFAVYDPSQDLDVWTYSEADSNHVHFGDGQWGISKQHLLYDHDYVVRSRFRTTAGVGEWNERSFRTEPRENTSDVPGNWTWTAMDGYKVELVASGLSFPVNVEDAPELYGHLSQAQQPLLYVSHLYGQIGMVTKDGSYVEYASGLLNYNSFGSLPGSGEMGVTGLYVDPSSGDVYASMVSFVGDNTFEGKVVRYLTNADGDGYTDAQVVIDGVPSAPSHQIQDITRGPDGALYVSVGDANMLETTKDPAYYNGKVLRIDESSGAVSVFAAGFRNPFGTAWRPGTAELYSGNNGPDSDDGIYRMTGGEVFGWCCDTAAGTWRHYPQTVVPTQLAFAPGDGSSLYVVLAGPTNAPGPQTRGKRVMRIAIDGGAPGAETEVVRYTGEGYGSPNGLQFIDGELYFTDLLGETGGAGNIYRVVPGVQTEDPAPGVDGFSATLAAGAWYPQGRDMIWECRASEGSGDYRYDYSFGDGNGVYGTTRSDVYYTYPADGTYDASCTAYDQVSGESASDAASVTIGGRDDGSDGSSGVGDNATNTTTNTTNTTGPLSLRIADWYPQGRDYVFVCEGVSADSYVFSFGDGDSATRSANDVYHTYAVAGNFTVTCEAAGENASLAISVS